jgi:hypothetical protein
MEENLIMLETDFLLVKETFDELQEIHHNNTNYLTKVKFDRLLEHAQHL